MALLNIRPATVADAGLILHFIRELAIYEKAEHSVQTDEIGIAESLFGADATARALICEADGEPIGYAVYFYNYSTWLGRKGIYLEDLYVSQEKRGAGAALFLADIQVFQVDALAAQPGGVVVEIHGVTNGLAVGFADQRARRGIGTEQALGDADLIGLHRMLGLLVDGQFADEMQDQAGIGHSGRTDVQQSHGRKRETEGIRRA